MAQKPALCCPPAARNTQFPAPRPMPAAASTVAPDYEIVTRCDPATDAQILIQYDASVAPPTVVSMTDLTTGQPFTGDITTLEPCGGAGLESDPMLMCDSGTQFLRHVVKKNGEPTGVKFDTNLSGALYTVADEASVSFGACAVASAPSISSATADDLSGLAPGQFISVQKPPCCKIKLKTSAGDVIIAKDALAFSTGKFDSNVSVVDVELMDGTCSPEDIIVTTQTSLPV